MLISGVVTELPAGSTLVYWIPKGGAALSAGDPLYVPVWQWTTITGLAESGDSSAGGATNTL